MPVGNTATPAVSAAADHLLGQQFGGEVDVGGFVRNVEQGVADDSAHRPGAPARPVEQRQQPLRLRALQPLGPPQALIDVLLITQGFSALSARSWNRRVRFAVMPQMTSPEWRICQLLCSLPPRWMLKVE